MSASSLNDGKCVCQGDFKVTLVEVRVNKSGKVLKDVPQGICTNCGLKVYKATMLELIESLYFDNYRLSI
jgi:hypothetical protein